MARVAREAIQNSVDATLPDHKTDVLLRNVTLTPEEAAAFRDHLGFNRPDSPLDRLEHLGLARPNALNRLADGEPVKVTIIEDRNTCGLGYDKRDQKDRFEELCLSLGQDRIDVSSGRGGSYGLGKAVYEEASNCNMFVVYSVFEPSEQTGGHSTRLFACATFDGHRWDDRKYTGRALFGIHEPGTTGQPECRPIVDDLAHEIADKIGFTRMKDECGTSLMIVGSSLDIDQLRAAVERWWWPRILSNKLSVELWVDADSVDAPEPRGVEQLEAHVACYEMIEHGTEPQGGKKRVFRRFKNQLRPGQLALMPMDREQVAEKDDSPNDTIENTVALIRSGPRMVVDYMRIPGAGDRKAVGVFLGHSDADEALHLSEPPSHDSWNPNSQRLNDAYPADLEKRELLKGLVDSIIKRIKNHAGKFLKDLNPVLEPPAAGGSRRLQQILAQVMSARRPSAPPQPPVQSDPFEMRIQERRTNDETQSVVAATIRLGLREDAPAPVATAKVSIVATVVMDDNMRRSQTGRVALASMIIDDEDVALDGGDRDVSVVVRKAGEVVIEVASKPFNREYYANLDVAAEVQPDEFAFADGRDFAPQATDEASS